MRTEEEIIQAIINREKDLSYEELKMVYGESHTLKEYYEAYTHKHPLARYIEQLIEDIEKLTEAGPPDPPASEEDKFTDFLEDEEDEDDDFLSGMDQADTPELTTFEALFGLEKIALPPPDRLNACFISDLSFALELLMDSYDITIVFPQYFPPEKLYEWLWSVWDSRKIRYSAFGITIKACTGQPASCALPPAYCECKTLPPPADAADGNPL